MSNANWEHAHLYMDDAGTVIASSDLSSQVVDLTGGVGGSQILLTATKHLTSADILTLNSVPVEVVPAPGSGMMIFPQNGLAFYNAGGTPYTPGAGNTHLELTTAPLAASGLSLIEVRELATLIGSATDLVASFFDGGNSDITFPQVAPASVEDEALVAFATVADPTLGDGTIDLVVYYTIVEIP